MNIGFVADFFADEVGGGGELNNEEFIEIVRKSHEVKKINSHLVTLQFLQDNKESKFIIIRKIKKSN